MKRLVVHRRKIRPEPTRKRKSARRERRTRTKLTGAQKMEMLAKDRIRPSNKMVPQIDQKP